MSMFRMLSVLMPRMLADNDFYYMHIGDLIRKRQFCVYLLFIA